MHRRLLRTGLALGLLSLTACSSDPQDGNRLGCVGAACDPDGGAGGTTSSSVRGPSGASGASSAQAGQGSNGRGGGSAGASGASGQSAAGQAGSSGTSAQAGTMSSGVAGTSSGQAGTSGASPVAGAAGSLPVDPYAGETCTEGRPCSVTAPCASGETCEAGVCTGHQSPSCGPVVHEWGTYTSVVASDGHTLGGLHHVDEPLPSWVLRRDSFIEKGYEELPEEPRQQLETPVLYFHTDHPVKVDVDVSFPQGVVGEWFPNCASFSPDIGQLEGLSNGRTLWKLRLDPTIDPATYPPVTPDEIWAPSRHVTSTPVSSIPNYNGEPEQHEQFLFYRGLATFVPPLTFTADASGTVRIHSGATESLGAVFVMRANATEGSFVSLGSLAAGGDLVSPVPATTVPREALIATARTALREALVGSGLYDDEALAMVDTWTRSWFGGDGTRVLYIAPRAWTDAWLPTTVVPTPSSFVRTLVGRVEVMTPAEETMIAHDVSILNNTQSLDAPALTKMFGRFAESRLERACELLVGESGWLVADELRQKAHGSSFYQ